MNPEMGPGSHFETARLEMRPMELTDSDFVVRLKSSYDVYRFFGDPHPLSLEEHVRWFRQVYSHDTSRVEFIIKVKELRQEIGVIGLSDVDATGSAKVDYSLLKEHRGFGYAFEALMGLCEFFMREFGGKKLDAIIHLENASSLALSRKCGFLPTRQDGVFVTMTKVLVNSANTEVDRA